MSFRRTSKVLEAVKRFFLGTADLWLAASLTAAAVYFFSGHFTTVRFDRERIDVQVNRGWIHVTALYHYANASRLPAVLTLRNPFPTDPDHPRPDSFWLSEATEDGQDLAELPVAVRGDDVTFRLFFHPGETKWVRLDYDQPTRVANGRYLLVTTRAWRRPIGRGEYLLRLPPNTELASSNYSLKRVLGPSGWTTYAFVETDFYPDKDWVFAWRSPALARPPAKEEYHEKQSFERMPAGVVANGRSEASLRQ